MAEYLDDLEQTAVLLTPYNVAELALTDLAGSYLGMFEGTGVADFLDNVIAKMMLDPAAVGDAVAEGFERLCADPASDQRLPTPPRALTETEKPIYVAMMISASCFAQALIAEKAGAMDLAWFYIMVGKYWTGIMHGAQVIGQMMIAQAVADRASAGGQAKKAKYDPLREFVRKAAAAGNYPSKRNAAMNLAPDAIVQAEAMGIRLSSAQAQKTIEGWLSGITFASRRTTPSGKKPMPE